MKRVAEVRAARRLPALRARVRSAHLL